MELKKYDRLRKKIQSKNFEEKNESLSNWLYGLSFLGNGGSIFFAYFLLYPALYKAITTNLVDGKFGTVLSIIFTISVLFSFEAIKRIQVGNFSFDLIKNKFKFLKRSIIGWFLFSACLISLSFYFSLNGAKNFASTNDKFVVVEKNNLASKIDSITLQYENKKNVYLEDNNNLREINNELRELLVETPLNYRVVRNDYQKSIDKNISIIENNQNEIEKINTELDDKIKNINSEFNEFIKKGENEDSYNILLFILISTGIEIIIILGIYFKEYYEYKLYNLNNKKLEKIYQKRDRYKALVQYIYKKGGLTVGEKIIGATRLIDIIAENTAIPNPERFVKTFLFDMEKLGVFVTRGKRRIVNLNYEEAIEIVNNFDDAVRIFDDFK